ncbi:tripartite tricarboxylate transporter TctB family protein [Pseudonocardia sp. TRM90224]|uniref:tripartite tricarboxylate transporter TctB family protein n=1 Tax=Pseudonocardia sp. TRM90224 TaxID=2812678 RepID=UPI001E47DBDD|nr:tripartite tricarboxylate transporter TctB family protein [Pseudonocardia sp. TRM90224]
MTAENAPATGAADGPGSGIGPTNRPDLVAGLLATALGVAVVLHVRTFPGLPDGQPGPALFPGLVGGLLVLFGLVLAVRSAVRRREDAAGAQDVPPDSTPRSRLNALAVLGYIVAYLLLADLLGFALTTAPLLFLLMWLLGVRPWVAALSAVATTVLVVLMFQQLLLVPLPTGPLGV